MRMDAKHAAGAIVTDSAKKLAEPTSSRTVDERAARAKKRDAAAKPKAAPPSNAKKAERHPPRPPRATSKAKKLVCRYCGSDDLSPSFKKRRDARCRACFKKRYGSATRRKRATRTRKTKAAK
jgi:hypothetical protein